METTAIFVIGLIVGILAANVGFIFILGLCRAASRADDYLDELENKAKYTITGK